MIVHFYDIHQSYNKRTNEESWNVLVAGIYNQGDRAVFLKHLGIARFIINFVYYYQHSAEKVVHHLNNSTAGESCNK